MGKVDLELLTDMDMFLMIEPGIKGDICYSVLCYAEVDNKHVKNYNENKESSYIKYLDKIRVWMSQKFIWFKMAETNNINDDPAKNYDKIGKLVILLKLTWNALNNCVGRKRTTLSSWEDGYKKKFV